VVVMWLLYKLALRKDERTSRHGGSRS